MSIRHDILGALSKNSMTADELSDALPDHPRKKIVDNVGQAVKDCLVDRQRDDVTGMPLYTISKTGIDRLKAGPGSLGGKPKKPVVGNPVSRIDIIGQNGNDGQHYEEMPPADAGLLAKANKMLSERLAGVAHDLRGSGLPGLANIDDGDDLQRYTAALTGAYRLALARMAEAEEMLDAMIADSKFVMDQRDAWREVAADLSLETPNDLRQYINDILSEVRPAPTGRRQPFGYAVILPEGIDLHDTEIDARISAEKSLDGEYAGAAFCVVAVLGTVKNVVAPVWTEAGK